MGHGQRYGSLAMKVLKVIGITAGAAGLVALAITAPNVVAAIGGFTGNGRRKTRRAITYLRERGFVTILSYEGDTIRMRLTRRGESVIKKIAVHTLELPHGQVWDKKWRLIIFDVPNKKSKQRQAFAAHLKNLGARMAQRSVWIYPYPCHEEIMILRKFYDIERYVTYAETSFVEDDDHWKGLFNL